MLERQTVSCWGNGSVRVQSECTWALLKKKKKRIIMNWIVCVPFLVGQCLINIYLLIYLCLFSTSMVETWSSFWTAINTWVGPQGWNWPVRSPAVWLTCTPKAYFTGTSPPRLAQQANCSLRGETTTTNKTAGLRSNISCRFCCFCFYIIALMCSIFWFRDHSARPVLITNNFHDRSLTLAAFCVSVVQ